MKRRFIAFLYFVLMNSTLVFAQGIRIEYANDYFTGTDRFFTQGIRIESLHTIWKNTPVRLLSIFNTQKSSVQYSLALQQDGFTPSSISRDTIITGDRPYCASSFFTNSQYVLADNGNSMRETRLDLGVMGPLALGYEEQTAIHKAIHNILPRGWRNQIQNDIILNYLLENQTIVTNHTHWQLLNISRIRIGTLVNDLTMGGELRLGFLNKQTTFTPPTRKQKGQFYFFIKVFCKAVGYNATLQGGIFNRNSPYTIRSNAIQRLIVQSCLGINVAIGNLQLSYSQSYLSKEFNTGTPHAWGKISIQISF